MTAIGKFGMVLGVTALALVVSACGGPSKRIQQGNIQLSISQDAYYKALSNQDSGRYFESVQAWSELLKSEPRFSQGHFNLGLVYDRLNMVPEAVRHYEIAVRLAEDHNEGDASHALYNLHLGGAYLRSNLHDEALYALQTAQAKDPYNPALHYNLAAVYMTRGNYDQGLIHANIAVDLLASPDASNTSGLAAGVDRTRLGRYLLRQAECHLARKEWAKARVVMERARDQADADVPASMWDRLNTGEKHAAQED